MPYSSKLNTNLRFFVCPLVLFLFLTSGNYAQELIITSPTPDTTWVGGTMQEITWTGGSSANVKIKFEWVSAGEWYETIIVQSTPNDGSFNWYVPDGCTDSYLFIGIYGEGEWEKTRFTREDSDGGIYITYLGYGISGQWPIGSKQEITWIDNISENVKINLYQDAEYYPYSPKYVGTITNSTPSDGSYTWTIPDSLSPGKYSIAIIGNACGSEFRGFEIIPQTSSCADRYEPNDEIENSSNTFSFSEIGSSKLKSGIITGTIHESGDWDHYLLNIEYPGILNIDLTNVPDGFDLQLYDDEPSYVDGSFTSGDENLNVSIISPGLYYIIVGSMESAYECSPYTLVVDWTPDLLLDITPNSRSVGTSQGTTTFEVSSKANWSASEQATWLSAEKTNSGLLTVTFDENFSAERRSAGITLSADSVSPIIVTVNQEGIPCSLSVSPESQTVGSDRGTTSFTVTSNLSWGVSEFGYSKFNWEIFGIYDNIVTVSFWSNPYITDETANLIIVGGDCSEIISITQEGGDCRLSVIPENLNVDSNAGTTSVTIYSNASWSVNESVDWLSTSVDGRSIIINYLENTSINSREDTIYISGGDCSDTVIVMQEGAPCSLIVTPESLNVDSKAGTESFTVTANLSWSVNESDEWLSVKVDGNIINANFSTNESTASRSASIMITGGECSQVVTVVQAGEQPVFQIETSEISLGATAGSASSFSITSNVNWSVENNIPWLNVNPLTGNGSSRVNVESNQSNNTGETRTDTLFVSGNGVTCLIVITQDYITGVFELLESVVNLYPNPTNTILTIETGNTDLYSFKITSLNGQLRYNGEMKGTIHQLDLSSFQKGVYLITIRSKDFVTTRKIVKL